MLQRGCKARPSWCNISCKQSSCLRGTCKIRRRSCVRFDFLIWSKLCSFSCCRIALKLAHEYGCTPSLFAKLYSRLGNCEKGQKKWKEAIKLYNTSLAIDNNPNVLKIRNLSVKVRILATLVTASKQFFRGWKTSVVGNDGMQKNSKTKWCKRLT